MKDTRKLLVEYDSGFIDVNHETNKNFIEKLNEAQTSSSRFDALKITEPLVLFTVLQRCDALNRNGRIYPASVLKKEARRYQDIIDRNQAMGESNHPDDSIINASRVSIGIKRMWFEGDLLVGEVQIIMSPAFVSQGIISCEGDNIANLLRNGYRVGVSSRGLGSVVERGGKLIVQDDFEIVCWDAVIQPSTYGAYMMPDKSKREEYRESIDKSEKSTLLEGKDNKFKRFLKNIK